MLKITYTTKPFYTEHALNDPSTTNLEIVFDEDAGYTEIIAKVMQVLEFMTFPKPTKTSWEHMMDTLIWEGRIKDDTEEKGDE